MKEPKFAIDCMLGKLARKLRILGFDAVYYRKIDDDRLIEVAASQERILLTRDTPLAERFRPSLLVESEDPLIQTKEVIEKLHLDPDPSALMSRCLVCNGRLMEVDRESVRGSVPPYVFRTQKRFSRCPDCQRIFWKATHVEGIESFIKEVSNDD